uniref:Arf-GAP domain-containing protein n=1 Tax=Ananas comosus var. bracteatus TaxID=296719 RepID=A0A6V7PF73_ANACO|nr:unnamed protein product [Ananas comosus var. bracteatus]
MSSKREEERNEKIIRGLMKLPPNRRCINCNSPSVQYVCMDFWTFVCATCSGIHREFTHRVKSVSLGKFNRQEVEALQKGGNQRAREIYLKDWDMQRMRLPDNSNVEKIRDFIRSVYVNKKYAGGRSSERVPRDLENLKNHEEDVRRASSYHSYSQSPPYDDQYEDRRYGKQASMLSRRPGSDRAIYEGRLRSFIFSPGRMRENMYEDRFANESSGSRFSDFSLSSASDQFRYDAKSPSSQDTGYHSPPVHQLRDVFIEDQPKILNQHSDVVARRDLDGIQRPQRTASSGSFGSLESSTLSRKSVDSCSIVDVAAEPVQFTGNQHPVASPSPLSAQPHASLRSTNQVFNQPITQPSAAYSYPITGFSGQPSSMAPPEQKPSSTPFSENQGWATFDLPNNASSASDSNTMISVLIPPPGGAPKVMDALKTEVSVQNPMASGPISLTDNQWHVGVHEAERTSGQEKFQPWNAFDDSIANVHHNSLGNQPQINVPHVPFPQSFVSGDHAGIGTSKELVEEFGKSDGNDIGAGLNFASGGFAESSFSASLQSLPGMVSQTTKSTNPFDLPFESELEVKDAFLDMSSLQAVLPNPEAPADYVASLAQPWFPQNPAFLYYPSFPQAGLAYMSGHAPNTQIPKLSPQDPIESLGGNATLGGNPFA